MRRLLAICRTTFLQTIRQPIYGVLIVCTFAILVLSVPLTGFALGTGGEYRDADQKMLEGLGLGTLLMTGLLLGVFGASAALAREIEDRTALTVISKPVSRATFVLGKFAGAAAAVAVAFYLCSLVYLMTIRHGVLSTVNDPVDWPVIVLGCAALGVTLLVALLGNYFFGWTFTSTSVLAAVISFTVAMGLVVFIDKGWKPAPLTQVAFPDEPTEVYVPGSHEFQTAYDRRVRENTIAAENGAQVMPFTLHTYVAKIAGGIPVQLLTGMAMIFLAVLVFVAVAVAASTRLGTVLTLLVCAGLFAVGWMHPTLFDPHDENFVLRVLSWAAPNMTYFDPQDPLSTDKPIPLSYLGLAAAYAACYVAAVLAVGIALFQRRALEAATASGVMPGAVSVLAGLGRLAAVALAVAAVVVVSMPEFHSLSGFLLAAGLALAAVAAWMLWGFFGRGDRWSYWVVLVLTVAALAHLAVSYFLPAYAEAAGIDAHSPAAIVQAIVLAGLLLILLLPKTRRHFSEAS